MGLPFYAEDLPPREQDLEQAAALLRQAGKENLKVTLHTSDIVPGFVEAATLFAQQAQGAGVTVEVKREPANAYFDTSLLYTKLDFAQSFWTYSSIPLWYEQALLSDAVWNETHWRDPETDRLIRQAQGAPTRRPQRSSGIRSRRSSTRRAATSSGPTRASSTAPPRTCRESSRARSSTSGLELPGRLPDVRGAGRHLVRPAS